MNNPTISTKVDLGKFRYNFEDNYDVEIICDYHTALLFRKISTNIEIIDGIEKCKVLVPIQKLADLVFNNVEE